MRRWCTRGERLEINLLFSRLVRYKKPSKDVFSYVVAHNIELLLNVKNLNRDNFGQRISKYYNGQHIESCLLANYGRHIESCLLANYGQHIESCLLANYGQHIESCLLANYGQHIGFRLVCLRLTLTHPKDQSQGHVHFDCVYLVHGDRYDKYY